MKERIIELLEQAQKDIRDYRDSDEHICPADVDEDGVEGEGPCTCGQFDDAIDEIDLIIKQVNKLNN